MKYLLGLSGILAVVVAGSASAAVRHVPSQYATIQAGVDAAVAGDTVLVAAGTYTGVHVPPGTDTTPCVVHMKSGVSLIGAGAATTTINADSLGRGIYCYGVTGARIEGFKIRRAFAQLFGAGIFCTRGSTPLINNCQVVDCYDGGIIVSFNSNPTITNSLLRANLSKQGGGLAVEDSSSATVTGCTITRNTAPVAGGVFVRGVCTPTFRNCVIDSNFLNTINGSGGGVAVRNSQVTFRNCRVNRNASSGVGGGFDIRDNSFALIESTLVQHDSTTAIYGPGGGIYCELSDMDLDYCTISSNRAPGASSDGGGIYLFFCMATTITNCTIAGNGTAASPDGLGAGITCYFSSPVIEKSIFAFNTPGQAMSCLDESSVPVVSCTDLHGNQDGNGICGTDAGGNFHQDPLFCDAATDNYGLRGTSPCLPGQHPSGAPCGLIGAFGVGSCAGAVEWPGGPVVSGRLHFAAPNPSAGSVTLHFAMSAGADVAIAIYDAGGRLVRRLAEGSFAAGWHEVTWDARDERGGEVPSGIYFYRLGGGVPDSTGRIVLTR